jgi:RNA-directed DNA polymerase
MTTMLEPKGKLDAAPDGVVNGPEDGLFDWDAVDWRVCEQTVRRLRQRIFTASQAGDLKRVRNLQKLMLRSRSNTLLGVRRVTEINAGRLTAGVDGRIVLDGEGKAGLVVAIHRRQPPWQARPVRRVYIPKADGKRRPLGIPVIMDRVLQARVLAALEPEWEARFEPKSYGFRPGRGCQDAIQSIFQTAKGKNPARRWVLDADLKAAFDRIDHTHLLGQLGWFPAREQVRDWLTAGVVERGWFTATEEGTPQGGVISPLLLNVALHGMEHAAGVRYRIVGNDGAVTAPTSPVLVRYADDFVALCHTRDEAIQVKARLGAWLTPRGLAFNEDKTRMVDLDTGHDFLGFTVRRYHDLLLIKPSKAAIRRIRQRLRTEMLQLRGANAAAVIARLNPIVRGWAAYYRSVVSSEISTRWITTCGNWFTNGPDIPTRTSRRAGSSPATSARSTRPGVTSGSSVTATAAPTCTSSPGPGSCATRWSPGPRRSTTRPWPTTGTADGDARDCNRQSTAPPNGCSTARTGGASTAGSSSCTPTARPKAHTSGNKWLRGLRKAMAHNAIRQDGTPHDPQIRLLHTHCHRRTTGKRQTSNLHASDPSGLA